MSDPNAWQLPTFYTADKKEQLRYKFKNVDLVNHQNFSQCYQDMFVLCMLDGKPYGTFCEIGAGHPVISNNTALLESRFAWNGIGFEIKEHEADLYNENRKAPVALGDATTADFDALFNEVKLGPVFDYLQVDCEPAQVTFDALKKIDLDKYKFATVTFEHDCYNDGNDVRDESRKYFEDRGYVLIADNISVDDKHPYEDWWAHPDLVPAHTIEAMKCVTGETKKAEDYMLGKV
jgi:hypothetical protein|tara:strand:+ start:719 stop:1420 length:702 start_codon:yes stop_codon:yes gene_type:complete